MMLPIQKKSWRVKNFTANPFPSNVKAVGYFTGLDVEIFDQSAINQLHESGCFGLNPKPRQANHRMTLSDAEYTRKLEWNERLHDSSVEQETVAVAGSQLADPFNIPQSLVLFPEEAFFLHQFTDCLQVRDLDDVPISTESLWIKFRLLKETFVECYVAYLYLKSKNWVIKSGIKFGGDFCKFSILNPSIASSSHPSSALQTRTAALPRIFHRSRDTNRPEDVSRVPHQRAHC